MSKESEVLKKLNLIQKVFEKLADWNAYDLAKLDKDYETNFDLDFLEIERSLKELEVRREMMRRFNEACVPTILDNETEKKLKEHEEIKTYMQQYGIENVEELRRVLHNDWVIRQKFKTDTANVSEALEIIQDKSVNVSLLFNTKSHWDYNDHVCRAQIYLQSNSKCLTQDEFNLLKEVLKDE